MGCLVSTTGIQVVKVALFFNISSISFLLSRPDLKYKIWVFLFLRYPINELNLGLYLNNWIEDCRQKYFVALLFNYD